LEDTAENSKIEDTAGRYTLGGHSRDSKNRGHSREIHTWRTQQRF
jgi:hypothetical protein